VLGFVVVLIVGWLVAAVIARAVLKLLQVVRFDHLAERSGLAGFVRGLGASTGPSAFVASLAQWFVRLITLVVAFDTLGLPAVSGVLQQLLLWLPNLVVALVVLVLGGLAARALGNLVRASTAEAGFSNPDLLASVARGAVLAFAVVVAVNQIGIAQTLINTLLVGVVGALALAAGLAFGLGGRDKAAQILDAVGRQLGQAGPRAHAAARAGQRARPETRGLHTAAADVRSADVRAAGAGPALFVQRSGRDRRQVVRDAVESGRGPDWVVRSGRDRRTA
jgi:hypothetical protein